MKRVMYTYSVVKYVHDPAAGEMLNVGIILCAPSIRLLAHQFEYKYERLSATFINFDGDHYRHVIRQITSRIINLSNQPQASLFESNTVITDSEQLANVIMPDRGLSFQFGPMLAGITHDPETEIRHIYDRMIASQYPHGKEEKRTDDEVWSEYQSKLVRHRITPYLRPKVFTSEDYEFKFEHTIKNQRWHILQPVSMDYARPEGLQYRATRLLGTATALKGNRELGELYVLLGQPSNSRHRKAYERAKHLLSKMPIKHKLIEEDEAEDFAKEIDSYMKAHGIKE